MEAKDIARILGKDRALLTHKAKVSADQLTLPGRDYVSRAFGDSDRPAPVLRNLQTMFDNGRLRGTGYLSIFPVDQGIEHTGGASFAPNPAYFDPENIVKMALDGGCNAVVSSLGVLGAVSRKYAHKIPFILKLNHNELLTYPNTHDQTMFASVEQAFNLGAVGVGATVYYGSADSRRQMLEVSEAFEHAHSLGMFTVLWAYLRNPALNKGRKNMEVAGDVSGQATHLAATIQADIVKQKLAENNHKTFGLLNFGKSHPDMYTKLMSSNPIDLARYQVLNTYAGRVGLVTSGGASEGKGDLHDAVRTAVINKRAGGMGVMSGRRVFKHPVKEGVKILHAIQDVYRSKDVTIA